MLSARLQSKNLVLLQRSNNEKYYGVLYRQVRFALGMTSLISLEDITKAQARIHGYAHRTPAYRAFSEESVWLKMECFQPVRSFKIRGAVSGSPAINYSVPDKPQLSLLTFPTGRCYNKQKHRQYRRSPVYVRQIRSIFVALEVQPLQRDSRPHRFSSNLSAGSLMQWQLEAGPSTRSSTHKRSILISSLPVGSGW